MKKRRVHFFRNLSQRQPIRSTPRFLFVLLISACAAVAAQPARAQMNPYFTAVSSPMPRRHLMLMLLPDYQLARVGPDYLTYMGMAEYGITGRWTAGFMAEGQKINGLENTFGGFRFNTYYELFPRDSRFHFTLYAEYEDLNQASLYKMEVSGFGVSDLTQPLHLARNLPAHTLEQRAIAWHDWGRLNFTFNFVSEFDLEDHSDDFGYVWGLFRRPEWDGMRATTGMHRMNGMSGQMIAPAPLSLRRFGYGLEMMGGLGDTRQFGFFWRRQQQYLGPLLSYSIAPGLRFRLEPAFGLSNASDRFVLRMGFDYSIDRLFSRHPG